MIRALIAGFSTVILVLAITAIFLWGWGQKNENRAIKSDYSLEVERAVSSDLRIGLEAAQNSNKALVEQLQQEKQLVAGYQVKSQKINADFLAYQEQIRILEHEDKNYRVWGDAAIPFGVVSLLNKASPDTNSRY